MKLLNKRLFYKSGRNGFNLKEKMKMKMTVNEKEQKRNTKVASEQNVDSNDGDELEEGSTPMKLLSKIDDLAPSLVSLTNDCFLLKEQKSSLSDDDVGTTSLSSQCDKSKNKRKARKAVCILCIMTIVGNESHVVSLVKEHRILIPLLNALDHHWWAVNCDGCHFDDGKDNNNNNNNNDNNEEEEEKKEVDDYSINRSSASNALPWNRSPDLHRRLEKEQKLLCLIFEAIERILEVFFHPNNGCYLVDHSEVMRELLSYTMLDSKSSSSTTSFAELRGCDTYRRHKMKEMEGRANKVLQAIFNLGQNNNKSNIS